MENVLIVRIACFFCLLRFRLGADCVEDEAIVSEAGEVCDAPVETDGSSVLGQNENWLPIVIDLGRCMVSVCGVEEWWAMKCRCVEKKCCAQKL